MNNFLGNILLLLFTALIQSLVFDNITLSISLTLLPYILFIALQPMQRSPIQMIFWGFTLGAAVDIAVGTAGINTISTLAVSYLRVYILQLCIGKDLMSQGGIPRMGVITQLKLFRYILTITTLHSLIYFAFESMNISSLSILATRFAISLATTILFVWLLTLLISARSYRYSN